MSDDPIPDSPGEDIVSTSLVADADGRLTTPPPPSLTRSEMVFWDAQPNSSPFKPRDTLMTNSTEDDKNRHHREAAIKEVGPVYEIDLETLKNELKDLATPAQCSKFFKTTDLYQDGRWTAGLPLFASNENELYAAYVAIISGAIDFFHKSLPPGVEREAVDTHAMHLAHDDPSHYTLPDISIRAAGPSFEVPKSTGGKNKTVGYRNVASVVDAKIEANMADTPTEQVKQSAVWNREIYIQQPNREWVQSLFVTEHRCRFVHFDRSGVYVSPLFDIHSDEGKVLFLKCILSVVSPNEAVLGLDTSVKWQIGKDGKKVSGTISVVDAKDNITTEYNLNMTQPPFVRPGIRCRGTVAWHATHPTTGEEVVIKDSWRSDIRDAEYLWLEDAKDIPGFPTLLSYQDDIAQTINFRPACFSDPELKANYPDFHNRIKSRLVLKKYGPIIWFFRTRLQFVKAIRDCFSAHKQLYEKEKILHRDIAVPNMLLGLPDDTTGPFGILVDLDMAIAAWREIESISKDPRSAYRFYVSISNILRVKDQVLAQRWVPPHNYTDDIEGFFYSTLHVMYHFKQPGVRNNKLDPMLLYFRLEDDNKAYNAKENVILRAPNTQAFSPYWGEACCKMYAAFHGIIQEIYVKLDSIRKSPCDNGSKTEALRSYAVANVQSHYERVLAIFDTAIEALEEEGLNAEEREPYPTTPEPYPLYRNPLDIPQPVAAVQEQSSSTSLPAAPTSTSREIENMRQRHSERRASRKRASEDRGLESERNKRNRGSGLGQSSLSHSADVKNDTVAGNYGED